MSRESFDAALERGSPPYRFTNRYTGEDVELSPEDFEDLCRVHLWDWLEQVERNQRWHYRRRGHRLLAERLGAEAVAAFDEVYAHEGAGAPAS
jgi:hypothetical protein